MPRAYHGSDHCKRFVAAKVDRLSRLAFMRTHPDDWTPEQRAQFEAWYPGDLHVAIECLADMRFPLTH